MAETPLNPFAGKKGSTNGDFSIPATGNPVQPLPISVQEFVDVVRDGQLYVDKTKIIRELLNYRNKYVFLFRPRRFGKSLLLSTIEAILLGRKELFDRFEIGNLKPEYPFESSHVIRFSMGSLGSNPDSFEKNLVEQLKYIAFQKYGLHLTSSGIGGTFLQLIQSLHDSYDSIPLGKAHPLSDRLADLPKVAVLIDECDYQLLPNIHDPKKLQSTINFLSDFYSGLKAVSGMIRHLIVTGITKFKTFYQSSSNFIDDISLDPDFSKICGFTQAEIRTNFWKHIEHSLKKMKMLEIVDCSMTEEKLYASIIDWYDGYTWDGKSNILNPVSLMQFFSNHEFKQYWYDTGDSGIIGEFIKSDKEYFKMFSDNSSIQAVDSSSMFAEITPYSVLYQTGYLTIKKITRSRKRGRDGRDIKIYHLAIPNREVREALAQNILLSRFFSLNDNVNENELYDRFIEFCEYFAMRKESHSQKALVTIFSSYSYKLHSSAESYYKTLILTALCFSEGQVTAEVSVGGGDIDLFLELQSDIMIIEVKYNHYPGSTAGKNNAVPQETSSASSTSAVPAINQSVSPGYGSRKDKADIKKDVSRLLDKGINDAFNQIDAKGYAKKYLYAKQKKTVWLVAVSVVGRDDAKIKFRKPKIGPGLAEDQPKN
ncbi:MAG: AAA family ATPase [Deltaproteobacteria bacterium]|nr:AAA family ATPase [Deltaproteobacteria bacterium]